MWYQRDVIVLFKYQNLKIKNLKNVLKHPCEFAEVPPGTSVQFENQVMIFDRTARGIHESLQWITLLKSLQWPESSHSTPTQNSLPLWPSLLLYFLLFISLQLHRPSSRHAPALGPLLFFLLCRESLLPETAQCVHFLPSHVFIVILKCYLLTVAFPGHPIQNCSPDP